VCILERGSDRRQLHNEEFYDLYSLSNTVCSESRCAPRLRYVNLIVSIKVAIEVCCCFTVFSC
jgi:hypothetical protein